MQLPTDISGSGAATVILPKRAVPARIYLLKAAHRRWQWHQDELMEEKADAVHGKPGQA
jgi:hypothetical protein